MVCRTGHRSDIACQRLTEKGFKSVRNVTPGMSQWLMKSKKTKINMDKNSIIYRMGVGWRRIESDNILNIVKYIDADAFSEFIGDQPRPIKILDAHLMDGMPGYHLSKEKQPEYGSLRSLKQNGDGIHGRTKRKNNDCSF